MSYSEFIEKVKTEELPGQHVLKESRAVPLKNQEDIKMELESIRQDVMEPEFYARFAKLETIELIQGAEINEKPHY